MKIFSLRSAPLTGLVSQTSEHKVASSQFGAQYDDRGLKLKHKTLASPESPQSDIN